MTAWESTPKAEAPRPKPVRPLFERPARRPRAAPPLPVDLPADTRVRKLSTSGTFRLDSVTYMVDAHRAFQQILVVADGDKIIVSDAHGEILVEHTRPAAGIKYVGNGRPRGRRPKTPETSPKS